MMTLRQGSTGIEVKSLQAWLVGQGLLVVADGDFGQLTKRAVIEAQRQRGLTKDGEVGPMTRAAFVASGWQAEPPTGLPPLPSFKPLSGLDRQRIWGQIVAVPLDDRSNIRITNSWPRDNLASVVVPQLVGIEGAPKGGKILWHRRGVSSLLWFWNDVEKEGLLNRVLTWAGSYVPRFVRGSVTTLSSHAHATAFDINAAWNGLGQAPAPLGAKGSVVELVPIMHRHGFFWGGHFSRPDAMHAELTRPDTE